MEPELAVVKVTILLLQKNGDFGVSVGRQAHPIHRTCKGNGGSIYARFHEEVRLG